MSEGTGSTRPSNFVVLALIVVAAILLWFAWGTVHHRSADQKILIEKSK